jgi:hypothetical protein
MQMNRIEAEKARKAQEKQRRKQLLLEQKIQKDAEQQQLDQLIESKLFRQSKQERRIAEQYYAFDGRLMQVRHEKEVMQRNRAFRDEQYAIQRQKEYEEALRREHELFKQAQNEYRHHVGIQMEQHQELMAKKREAKNRKNEAFVKGLLNQIITLSLKISDYRKISHNRMDDKIVMKKKIREWKTLLLNDIPLETEQIPVAEIDGIPLSSDEPVNNEIVPSCKEPIPQSCRVLDAHDFNDYLEGLGMWKIQNENG